MEKDIYLQKDVSLQKQNVRFHHIILCIGNSPALAGCGILLHSAAKGRGNTQLQDLAEAVLAFVCGAVGLLPDKATLQATAAEHPFSGRSAVAGDSSHAVTHKPDKSAAHHEAESPEEPAALNHLHRTGSGAGHLLRARTDARLPLFAALGQ